MTTPTEFFRFWIIDERTGKRRKTTYMLTRADASACLRCRARPAQSTSAQPAGPRPRACEQQTGLDVR